MFVCTVIHFSFGADLISVISVQAFFTEIKSLPKFQLRVDECSCLFKVVWIPLTLPKFSPYQTCVFSLYVIDIGRCLSDKWFIGYGHSEWLYEAKPSTTTRNVRT